MDAVKGQKRYISVHTLALTLNVRFIPERQFCLPKIHQEMRSVMTLSLHSASISRILEPSPLGLISSLQFNRLFKDFFPSLYFFSRLETDQSKQKKLPNLFVQPLNSDTPTIHSSVLGNGYSLLSWPYLRSVAKLSNGGPIKWFYYVTSCSSYFLSINLIRNRSATNHRIFLI